MSPALVLAGNSFLGRHLTALLEAQGFPVQAASRRPLGGYLLCDLTRPTQVASILADLRPRWIFQCAGATLGGSRADMDRLHVQGTEKLLDACSRIIPETRIVLFGSAAEYGPVHPSNLPIKESQLARPTSDFGQSKLAQSRVAEEKTSRHGLRIAVVRPFNILGPGLPEHYFAGRLCRRLHAARQSGDSGPMPIANAQATRDWIDVRDVAEAVVQLAIHWTWPPGQLEIYNVATGRETAVLAVAQQLCTLAGPFQATAAGSEESRSDIDRSCGDASKIRGAIGWRPRISWEESAAAMWATYKRESA